MGVALPNEPPQHYPMLQRNEKPGHLLLAAPYDRLHLRAGRATVMLGYPAIRRGTHDRCRDESNRQRNGQGDREAVQMGGNPAGSSGRRAEGDRTRAIWGGS